MKIIFKRLTPKLSTNKWLLFDSSQKIHGLESFNLILYNILELIMSLKTPSKKKKIRDDKLNELFSLFT